MRWHPTRTLVTFDPVHGIQIPAPAHGSGATILNLEIATVIRRNIYAFLSAALFFGCEEAEKLLTFHISDSTTIRIESTSPLDLPIGIPTPQVSSNSQQQYDNNNTAASLVKDVRLEQLKLTITDPANKTFSFLKSIHIFISSDQHNEIELASLDNISSSVNSIDLVPTDVKLDPYIRASSYTLRTEVVTDEALTEPVDIRVDLRFRVTADTF